LAEGATHVGICDNIGKSAFTLAEVLITLAIIGVVAAITIPTLMGGYKKNLVETRLKHFYSTINQAVSLSEIDNGNKKSWKYTHDSVLGYNEDVLRSFYDTYYKNYIKVQDAEYVTPDDDDARPALRLYFLNGSAVDLAYGGSDYMFYPEAKDAENGECDPCKTCFLFAMYPNGASGLRNNQFLNKGVEPYVSDTWDGTNESLKEWNNCAKLIQLNGWKIPDDYPAKF